MMSKVLTEVPALWIVFVSAVLSIAAAVYLKKFVKGKDPGNEDMVRVQGYIRDGARAFIKRQYTTLAYFVAGLAVLVGFTYSQDASASWYIMVISYILGSGASAWAGWIGMQTGVDANAKTAWAANNEDRAKGFQDAFNVSFFAGCVMGLLVTGFAIGGVWALYYFTSNPKVVLAFSFGASSIALFAKAGGGIYTKTADVAADIVGKIEQSLPEDDPRNPAAVADNVGDNVGDIAGMGADLFDSYVASLIATMLLAFNLHAGEDYVVRQTITAYPLIISAAGLFASLIGIFLIARSTKKEDPGKALNNGTYLATILFIGLAAIVTIITIASTEGIDAGKMWRNYGAAVFGVLAGLVIGLTTDYFTDDSKKPVQKIASASQQGHALNILAGFGYGLLSVGPPIVGIAIAMGIAYSLDGLYGVGMASVGMLSIVGTIVSNDAYGPVVDNARGIAEQGGLDEEVIRICDHLDSAGNTAKAITKGFAIGAAALTVLALLYSFLEEGENAIEQTLAKLNQSPVPLNMDITEPAIMIGLLLGTAVPAIYSAILIFGVDKNAQLMVKEIRRQFEEEPGILKGEVPADFEKCIDIATKGALKELIIPSLLAVVSPLLVGIFLGIPALGAFLAGSILSGFIFALLMSNAGGAWDNAKKYIEDGNLGGKGTLAHAASITGDTVGDPFKDTAGPSINTLICVLSLTASMFMTLFTMMPHHGLGWF